jgi:Domain of unknown function (DUF3883)
LHRRPATISLRLSFNPAISAARDIGPGERQLGFIVVSKGKRPAADWSEGEDALVLADYFDMLRKELLGQPYNKTKHRNALRPKLAGRSKSSVEYKHCNISAVLVARGLPYIDGYKPRGNIQALLGQAVDTFLDKHPDYLKQLADAPAVNPDKAPVVPARGVFVPPPKRVILPEPGKPWLSTRGRRIDFADQDAKNRRLAELGEGFVVDLERRRLRQAKRDDLAGRVRWMSRDVGDGLGYDVLSFDEADDDERFLEVKTTGLGVYFPFYVTATEVRCSEDVPQRYRLYRVFDFSRSPRVYVLKGSLRDSCRLEPVQYRAGLGPGPTSRPRSPRKRE